MLFTCTNQIVNPEDLFAVTRKSSQEIWIEVGQKKRASIQIDAPGIGILRQNCACDLELVQQPRERQNYGKRDIP
jgi:hypothetical protein